MINIEGRTPTRRSRTTFPKSPPVSSLQSNNGQEVHVKIKWPQKAKKKKNNKKINKKLKEITYDIEVGQGEQQILI